MFFILIIGLSDALFFTLPFWEYCIALDVENSKDLWGAYVISGEGEKNVAIKLLDPQNTIEYTNVEDTREGKFHISNPKGGIHRLCFIPTDKLQKTVSFEMYTEESIEGKLATDESIEPFHAALKKVSRNLEGIHRNFHFYQRREKIHREISERNCDKILWTAGFKFFILILISFLQLWGLKKILDSSKAVKI